MSFFYKEVDLENRAEMTDYLKNHFRYNTMNSWNRSTSYANNIKLHNLHLPKEIKDKAYEFVCGDIECPDWRFAVDDAFFMFLKETGYSAGFNGCSGGYIVMYETGTEQLWQDRSLSRKKHRYVC